MNAASEKRRPLRFGPILFGGLWLAALMAAPAVAGESAKGGKKDGEAAKPSEAMPEKLENAFAVNTRMWGDKSKSKFWSESRGGKGFRDFYKKGSNSDRNKPGKNGDPADGDADYELAAGANTAVLFRPAGYTPEDGRHWGVYIQLPDTRNKAEASAFYWQNKLVEGVQFKKILGEKKLFYLCPKFSGNPSDIRQIALALDALASLQAAYPELGTKRVYLGGEGDAARVAGIAAVNFPKYFHGYFAVMDVAFLFSAKPVTFRMDSKRVIYTDSGESSDVPYLEKELDGLGKSLRVAGLGIGDSYTQPMHRTMVRGLHGYVRKKIEVRLFLRDKPNIFEILPLAIDWFDGKKVPFEPINTDEYDFAWTEKS